MIEHTFQVLLFFMLLVELTPFLPHKAVSNLSRKMQFEDVPGCSGSRLSFLRERATSHRESVASAIFYRSHLFSPISQSSPSVLVDLLHVNKEGSFLDRRALHFTLYDTTYRYDFDSNWIRRMSCILSQLKNTLYTELVKEASGETHALMRIFVSVADCNLDYSSSPRFKTASRTVVRVGDFRALSKPAFPKPAAQVYSISLGDISVYLCNSRFPYNYENGLLLQANTVLQPHQCRRSVFEESEPETVQQSMNYRTVATIDSVDAVVALSSSKSRESCDPEICASVNVGQISLLVCKDSFHCFTGTLGEAVSEATALNEAALDALRMKSTESEPLESALKETEKPAAPRDALKDLQQQSIIRPAFGTSLTDDIEPNFLLDGYDWITIDSDYLKGDSIPKGAEYTARWYTDEEVGVPSSRSEDSARPGPRIATDHFRYRPVADPLGDGDMGIKRMVGANTKSQVQTRVLVHDLSLKIRLFDGYDWPEQLGKDERDTTGNAFIIPEVPSKKDVHDAVEDATDVFLSANSDDVKTKLMDDLLSGAIEHDTTLRNVPRPEERGQSLEDKASFRRLARRTGKYFQISASGISVRLDALEESNEHRVASCLGIKAKDFFAAETISNDRPVKMIGEWFNEEDHPRDSNDGILMMKVSYNLYRFLSFICSFLTSSSLFLPYQNR